MDDVIRIGFLVSNKFVVISKQLIIVYVFVTCYTSAILTCTG